MSQTTRLGLPYIITSQAQKEVTHNEGLNKLDALVQAVVQEVGINTPPSDPVTAQCYIIGNNPSDSFISHTAKIAQAVVGGWVFYAPFAGLSVYNMDDGLVYRYDGLIWSIDTSIVQNAPLLGVNATADTTNKLTVASSAVLFNHVGSSVQLKVNKQNIADSASFLFQSNWSGRAEFGTTGDDDFHLKVSPDGSMFYDALIADHTSGQVRFLQGIKLGTGTTLLSHYEEDVFTPRFGAVVTSYSNQLGYYTRIGNRVFAEIDIAVSSLNTSDTDANNVTDLPYPIGGTGSVCGSIDIKRSTLLNVSSGTHFIIQPHNSNPALIQIKDEQGNAYLYNSGVFKSSGRLVLSLQYHM